MSLPSPQQWLSLLRQQLPHVREALLLQKRGARTQLLAHSPSDGPHLGKLTEATAKAQKNARLHLHPSPEGFTLAQPVLVDGKIWGYLALQLNTSDRHVIAKLLQRLKLAEPWLALLTDTTVETDNQLLKLTSSALKQSSIEEVAIFLVNKLTSLCNCERLSLALYNGKTVNLQALSFAAHIDKRSDISQQLERAMLEACEQRSDIHFPQSDSQLITLQHQKLHELTGNLTSQSFLLRKDNDIIGVLTAEGSLERPLLPEAQNLLVQALALIGQVFHIKQRAQASTLSRWRKKLGRGLEALIGPEHLATKFISLCALAAISVMFLPGQHYVSAQAELNSELERQLAAPQDGFLKSVHVSPGDQVQAGQLLAELDDKDLRLEKRKTLAVLQQRQQEYDRALASFDRAEAAILQAQIEQAQAQIKLLDRQLKRSQITAPQAGLIRSEDIKHLIDSPISQGQVLISLSANDRYRVDLEVDERDIGYLTTEQTGLLRLTGLANQTLEFQLSNITPVSDFREGRNYFLIEASLNATTLPLRPGMTGSGKILIGEASLGWIWFHDLWHWLRLQLWL